MRNFVKKEPGILSAQYCFGQDFIGFKGHFPEKPILPGVCIIQAGILMLEEAKHKPVRLKEIILAKFFAPVTANEEIDFTLKESEVLDCEEEIEFLVSFKGKKIAQLKLRVIFED